MDYDIPQRIPLPASPSASTSIVKPVKGSVQLPSLQWISSYTGSESESESSDDEPPPPPPVTSIPLPVVKVPPPVEESASPVVGPVIVKHQTIAVKDAPKSIPLKSSPKNLKFSSSSKISFSIKTNSVLTPVNPLIPKRTLGRYQHLSDRNSVTVEAPYCQDGSASQSEVSSSSATKEVGEPVTKVESSRVEAGVGVGSLLYSPERRDSDNEDDKTWRVSSERKTSRSSNESTKVQLPAQSSVRHRGCVSPSTDLTTLGDRPRDLQPVRAKPSPSRHQRKMSPETPKQKDLSEFYDPLEPTESPNRSPVRHAPVKSAGTAAELVKKSASPRCDVSSSTRTSSSGRRKRSESSSSNSEPPRESSRSRKVKSNKKKHKEKKRKERVNHENKKGNSEPENESGHSKSRKQSGKTTNDYYIDHESDSEEEKTKIESKNSRKCSSKKVKSSSKSEKRVKSRKEEHSEDSEEEEVVLKKRTPSKHEQSKQSGDSCEVESRSSSKRRSSKRTVTSSDSSSESDTETTRPCENSREAAAIQLEIELLALSLLKKPPSDSPVRTSKKKQSNESIGSDDALDDHRQSRYDSKSSQEKLKSKSQRNSTNNVSSEDDIKTSSSRRKHGSKQSSESPAERQKKTARRSESDSSEEERPSKHRTSIEKTSKRDRGSPAKASHKSPRKLSSGHSQERSSSHDRSPKRTPNKRSSRQRSRSVEKPDRKERKESRKEKSPVKKSKASKHRSEDRYDYNREECRRRTKDPSLSPDSKKAGRRRSKEGKSRRSDETMEEESWSEEPKSRRNASPVSDKEEMSEGGDAKTRRKELVTKTGRGRDERAEQEAWTRKAESRKNASPVPYNRGMSEDGDAKPVRKQLDTKPGREKESDGRTRQQARERKSEKRKSASPSSDREEISEDGDAKPVSKRSGTKPGREKESDGRTLQQARERKSEKKKCASPSSDREEISEDGDAKPISKRLGTKPGREKESDGRTWQESRERKSEKRKIAFPLSDREEMSVDGHAQPVREVQPINSRREKESCWSSDTRKVETSKLDLRASSSPDIMEIPTSVQSPTDSCENKGLDRPASSTYSSPFVSDSLPSIPTAETVSTPVLGMKTDDGDASSSTGTESMDSDVDISWPCSPPRTPHSHIPLPPPPRAQQNNASIPLPQQCVSERVPVPDSQTPIMDSETCTKSATADSDMDMSSDSDDSVCHITTNLPLSLPPAPILQGDPSPSETSTGHSTPPLCAIPLPKKLSIAELITKAAKKSEDPSEMANSPLQMIPKNSGQKASPIARISFNIRKNKMAISNPLVGTVESDNEGSDDSDKMEVDECVNDETTNLVLENPDGKLLCEESSMPSSEEPVTGETTPNRFMNEGRLIDESILSLAIATASPCLQTPETEAIRQVPLPVGSVLPPPAANMPKSPSRIRGPDDGRFRRAMSPRSRRRSPSRTQSRHRHSPSPSRRRDRRSIERRRRSPSPRRRLSPSPRRRLSPSPRRRLSPSPRRRLSPLPRRRRSPSPRHRRTPSPRRRISSVRQRRSPSPRRRRSPSPRRRRSLSRGRRSLSKGRLSLSRGRQSLSRDRRRSLSRDRRRSLSRDRRRSLSRDRRRSPSRDRGRVSPRDSRRRLSSERMRRSVDSPRQSPDRRRRTESRGGSSRRSSHERRESRERRTSWDRKDSLTSADDHVVGQPASVASEPVLDPTEQALFDEAIGVSAGTVTQKPAVASLGPIMPIPTLDSNRNTNLVQIPIQIQPVCSQKNISVESSSKSTTSAERDIAQPNTNTSFTDVHLRSPPRVPPARPDVVFQKSSVGPPEADSRPFLLAIPSDQPQPVSADHSAEASSIRPDFGSPISVRVTGERRRSGDRAKRVVSFSESNERVLEPLITDSKTEERHQSVVKPGTECETLPLPADRETVALSTDRETVRLHTDRDTLPLQTYGETVPLRTDSENVVESNPERAFDVKTGTSVTPCVPSEIAKPSPLELKKRESEKTFWTSKPDDKTSRAWKPSLDWGSKASRGSSVDLRVQIAEELPKVTSQDQDPAKAPGELSRVPVKSEVVPILTKLAADPMTPVTPVSDKPTTPVQTAPSSGASTPGCDGPKPGKLKSRWLKYLDMENSAGSSTESSTSASVVPTKLEEENKEEAETKDVKKESEESKSATVPVFERIDENLYLSKRKIVSKEQRESRRMVCDCTTSKEERSEGVQACGEDCLNRLLMIECGSRCPCGRHCTNRRFQTLEYSKVVPFQTDWKGWGLRASSDIPAGSFVMEYVGEVLDYRQFNKRMKKMKDEPTHYYFMALNAEEVIDATYKGNISRFINHSCDPNAETQKWTVNGDIRIGFFTIKDVKEGEELTFDYRFERYGQEAQKCFCGSKNCRGFIGTSKTTSETKAATPSPAKAKKEKKNKVFIDTMLDEAIQKLQEDELGPRNKAHIIELARLMVNAESQEHRIALLDLLQKITDQNCLRLFLDYHGLSLIRSWMADASCSRQLQFSIIRSLKLLPITNRTILEDTKIFSIVCKWAEVDEANYRGEARDGAPEVMTTTPESKKNVASPDTKSERASETPRATVKASPVTPNKIRKSMQEFDDFVSGLLDVPETTGEACTDSQNKESPSVAASESVAAVEDKPNVQSDRVEDTFEARILRIQMKLESGGRDDETRNPDPTEESSESSSAAEKCSTDVIESSAEVQDASKTESSPEESDIANTAVSDSRGEADSEENGGDKIDSENGRGKDTAMTESAEPAVSTESNIEQKPENAVPQGTSVSSVEAEGGKDDSAPLPTDAEMKIENDAEVKPEIEDDSAVKSENATAEPSEMDNKGGTTPASDQTPVAVADDDVSKDSAQTSADSESEQDIKILALKLLEKWSVLKEAFRIPKKQLREDRIRNEQELEERYRRGSFDSRHSRRDDHRSSRRDSEKRRRDSHNSEYDDPRNQEDRERKVRKKQLQESSRAGWKQPGSGHPSKPWFVKDDRAKPLKEDRRKREDRGEKRPHWARPQSPNSDNSKLSKRQRRELFEAQVKEEEHNMMWQMTPMYGTGMEQYQQWGQYCYDPNTGEMVPMAPVYDQSQMDMEQFMTPQATPMIQDYSGMVVQPMEYQTTQLVPSTPIAVDPSSMEMSSVVPVMGPDGTIYQVPVQRDGTVFTQPVVDPRLLAQSQPQPVPQDLIPVSEHQTLEQRWEQLAGPIESTSQDEDKDEDIPKPPPKRKPKSPKALPPGWKQAKDDDGNTYYYHKKSRKTQWEVPTVESAQPSPVELERPRRRRLRTEAAEADSSTETSRQLKDAFRKKMSEFVVTCLNPYLKQDCTLGRIVKTEDFKYLARKLTHAVMSKELKHCRHLEDLEVNENVRFKTREYIRKYMSRFGEVYKKIDGNSPMQMDNFANEQEVE